MKPFRSSISRKVQIIFLLLTVSILMATFIATIIGTNYLLRSTAIDYTYQLVNEVDTSILSYQKSMVTMANAIIDAEEVQRYIGGDKSEEAMTVQIMDFAAGTREDISNIFLLVWDETGHIHVLSNKGKAAINPYADYKHTGWFQKLAMEDKDTVVTSSYVQNLIEGQYNWVISLGKAVRQEGKMKALVLIDLNYSSIGGILSNVMPEEQGYIYLLSGEGEIVYHPQQQLIFNRVKREATEIVATVTDDHRQVGDKVYVVFNTGIEAWKTVAVLDTTVVYRSTIINTIIYLVVALMAVALSYVVSYIFSGWFTRPIRKLAGQMEKVQNGNLSARVEVKTRDEIGHLGDSFNVMTSRIRSLVERIVVEQEEKRHYELNALRAQINPHFLYNTLDSIIWMAECDRNEEVIEMTSALSKMLRASISHQKSGVTLGQELQNVLNYLKIQKTRYSNKLDYAIHVDRSLYSRKAAHLVLQPLVENAIYHGIKTKEGGGRITISAHEEGSDPRELIIQVADTGVGMSQDEIQRILSKDGKDPYSIGVVNVNKRIALIYGEAYGLSIQSEIGVGTTVSIRMPSQDNDSEGEDMYENHFH